MKKIGYLMLLLMLGLSLVGCSQQDLGLESENPNQVSEQQSTATTRKIIYTIEMGIRSKQLLPLYDALVDLLNEDEWIESERIGSSSGQLVLRIKTTRLNAFTTMLRDEFEVTYFDRSSKDVSLQYYNNTVRIDSLTAEQARLIEMYASSNISDQIQINQRLSVIETELRELTNQNNQTDQWIEYSVVRIQLNASAPYDTLTFGQKIRHAFDSGIQAFVSLVEFIILTLITLLPFIVVFGPIVYGILWFNKLNYKKRMAKRQTK